MKQAGIVAISDDGRPVMNSRVMRRAMETARSFGMPVIDHCEDLNLSAGGDMHEGIAERPAGAARHSGRVGRRHGGARHPAGRADRRALSRRAHLIPLLGGDGRVRQAPRLARYLRSHAAPFRARPMPSMRPYDSNYKMKPPLRRPATSARCCKGIVSGTVDAIATDHAPHAGSEKMQEFEKCPFGIIGLETALGLALERLVHSGKIALPRMVELFTSGPARVLEFGSRQLRRRRSGRRDDLRSRPQMDLRREHVGIQEPQLAFRRAQFRGGPVATIVNGKCVWKVDKRESPRASRE